jgi:glycosyltransferase involved in cell wall biosynthesis
VDPSDPDAWADAALAIIANPAPALTKLEEARAKVLTRYTKEENVRRHANLYMRLFEDLDRSNRT